MRTFVLKHFPLFLSLLPNDWMDEWLGANPDQRGGVSRIYENIEVIASPSLNDIQAAWEEELRFEVSDDFWQSAIKGLKFNLYKIWFAAV